MKAYVLGWVLWGIANHEATTDAWIFKGGTCLKKCFFETYRFSEDLDFTLTDEGQLEEDLLRSVFADVAAAVYNHTGVELPTNAQQQSPSEPSPQKCSDAVHEVDSLQIIYPNRQ